MEPTTSNASAKVITALVIGLLVGFVAGVFWQDRRGGSDLSKDTLAATAKSAATDDKKAESPDRVSVNDDTATSTATVTSLRVADQTAGDRVTITSFDTKDTLWVAVREMKNGTVGNILGAQKVFAGNAQNVTVELLRPTVAGGTYKVVLYKDIGTPAFNYREDIVVEGVEGSFTAK